jgi:hypothetical protein
MTSAEDLIAALERAPDILIPLVRQLRAEDWNGGRNGGRP